MIHDMRVEKGDAGMKPYQVRQGDVLLVPVDDPRDGSKKAENVAPQDGRFVLVYGEATGHAHTVQAVPGVEMFKIDSDQYLKVGPHGLSIHHQEHDFERASGVSEVLMPHTTYKVVRQMENDPWVGLRPVLD